MSKSLSALLIVVATLFSNLALASQEALANFLGSGQLVISTQPGCEPHQSDLGNDRRPEFLSQDIASMLTDFSGKPLTIASSCEPGPNNGQQCRVIFSVNEGELEWARIYQFRMIAGESAISGLESLECFNLP